MVVIIDVTRFYDWFPLTGDLPVDAVTKPDQHGHTVVRGVVDVPSFTHISIPEGQITAVPKERNEAIAWLIGERVMPHHAPRDAWVNITVEGDPELEAYLKQHFGMEA